MDSKRDVLQEITNAVIAALEAGVTPWRRPWRDGVASTESVPHNAVTRRAYSGVNFVWLTLQGMKYQSNAWLTFKQAQELGGTVKKAEKGTPVVFWKPMERRGRADDGSERTEKFLLMRYYTVFSVEQCEGLTLPKRRAQPAVAPINPDDAMGPTRALMAALHGVTLKHGGNRAAYSPDLDVILMPQPKQFSSVHHYRATLAHESTHATGNKQRLDRNLTGRFGSDSYAAEELVAELGAAMVGARLGMDTSLLEHHASYLETWLRVLKGDKKALMTAASKAQQACNYLLPQEAEQEDEQEEPALAMAA